MRYLRLWLFTNLHKCVSIEPIIAYALKRFWREITINCCNSKESNSMASHQKLTEQESSVTSNPNRRTHRRAGLATVAAATAALALAACAPSNVDATPEPTETSTSVPAPEFEGASPEDFIIPAGLDAEAAAEAVVEGALTSWDNAGANDSLRDRILGSDDSFDSVIAEVVAENKEVATDNLFVDGWESVPSLVSLADGSADINYQNLQWFTSTAWSQDEKPENTEGFRTSRDVIAVQEIDDGDGDPNTRTIKLDYTTLTNGDKNEGPESTGETATMVIDLVSDGKQERLADFEVF